MEHILLRPDTYIGSIESEVDSRWLVDPHSGSLELRRCSFVPGLFKVFDEILVNAADNKQRDASMSLLKVDICQSSGSIAVYNNGRGIPVELHRDEGVYVPELIFGHLLTSSNYNDGEKKTVGGRNGYGAKLANIFSTHFSIDTHDSSSGRSYSQQWSDNMQTKHTARITAGKAGGKDKDFTRVTFTPDYRRFGCSGLSDDMLGLMMRRVWDIAGTSDRSLQVQLNGKQLQFGSFSEYASKFLTASAPLGSPPPVHVCEQINSRWEVSVSLSTDGHFNQMSWVNSIATSRGGTHITYLQDQLVKAIGEHVEKKHKKVKVKPAHIKSHLTLFVNALIDNPSFDTQTKECLTLKKQNFGSTCELSDKFVKSVIARTGVVDAIIELAQFKESKELKKNDGKKHARITGIPKLDDANDAGTRNGQLCTLILTEGDSAKALAVSGLSVVGRDRYGIFPLRGKLLNVREASAKQIMDNAEVGAIKKILGLQQGKVYKDASGLRYGSVMIMTDQDHDGSHIKGLIINLFATFWPSLLHLPGFLTEFITPIVKVRNARTKEGLSFFTLPEYNTWRERQGAAGTVGGWSIKYYKGLGTSTSQEAKEYFTAILRHRLEFQSDPHSSAALELAFGKSQADARKEWLAEWSASTFLDQSKGTLTFSDFVNKELILFSVASNQRAIPSLVDGLKPGQRKILYACFLKRLAKEIKVAQLAGYVAEKSAYHHGEQALTATIVGMAQSFVGSNNINLLYPSGMFGTRLAGGKDAASARYIFTRLCPIARSIFPMADDSILNYLNDDGLDIEPDYYLPVLPMVLVNGSSGIGTGWSSNIPNFDPRQLAHCILRRLQGGSGLEELHPYYKGFTGAMAAAGVGRYQHSGRIEQVDESSLSISELPVQVWTAEYKLLLEEMLDGQEIRSYREYHTDTTVGFVVQLQSAAQMAEWQSAPGGLYKRFKLVSSLSTSNMVLFDQHGRLRRYDSVGAIMDEFYQLRLLAYGRRKVEQVRRCRLELKTISNKCRFIVAVVSDELRIRGVRRADIVASLTQRSYEQMSKNDTTKRAGPQLAEAAEEEADEWSESGQGQEDGRSVESGSANFSGFEYLLSMPLYALTLEKVEQLKRQKGEKEAQLRTLLETSEQQMWTADIQTFLTALEQHEEEERRREDGAATAKGRAGHANSAATKGKGSGKAAVRKEANMPRGVWLQPPEPTKEKEAKEKKPKAAKRSEAAATPTLDDNSATAGAAMKKSSSSKVGQSRSGEYGSDDSNSSALDTRRPLTTQRQPREARPTRTAAANRKKYVEEDEEDEEEEEAREESEEDEYQPGESDERHQYEERGEDDDDFASLSDARHRARATQPTTKGKPSRDTTAPHGNSDRRTATTKATKQTRPPAAQQCTAEGDDDGAQSDVAEMSLSDRLALRLHNVSLAAKSDGADRKDSGKRTISKVKAHSALSKSSNTAADKQTPNAKRQKSKPAVAVQSALTSSRPSRAAASKQPKYIEVSDEEDEGEEELYEMEEISDEEDDADDSDY